MNEWGNETMKQCNNGTLAYICNFMYLIDSLENNVRIQ